MSRLKLASILALFIGPFILFMNYSETSKKQKTDREGIKAVAEPMAKIEKRRKRGKTYKLEIEFPLENGTKQTTQVEVSRELYDRIETMPALEIKYLKDNPSEPIVTGEPLTKPEMNYVGIGALLFGGFGTWWYFIRKQPQQTPPPIPSSEPPPMPPAA